jgi:hypothetical protein
MTTKPNRTRQQSTGTEVFRQKETGDAHTEMLDETGDAPHRPHRASRTDTQKTGMDGGDRAADDASS